jgi:hypothetical protein
MTKGLVVAAAAAIISIFAIVPTASAQYPEPKGNLVCGVSQVSVKIVGDVMFTATLRDASGNAIAGESVYFDIVSQKGDAELSDDSTTTNASGTASVKIDLGEAAGQAVVSATSGDGLECRAVADVLSGFFTPPPTGDAGLLGEDGMPKHYIALAAMFGLIILSTFWLVARQK